MSQRLRSYVGFQVVIVCTISLLVRCFFSTFFFPNSSLVFSSSYLYKYKSIWWVLSSFRCSVVITECCCTFGLVSSCRYHCRWRCCSRCCNFYPFSFSSYFYLYLFLIFICFVRCSLTIFTPLHDANKKNQITSRRCCRRRRRRCGYCCCCCWRETNIKSIHKSHSWNEKEEVKKTRTKHPKLKRNNNNNNSIIWSQNQMRTANSEQRRGKAKIAATATF